MHAVNKAGLDTTKPMAYSLCHQKYARFKILSWSIHPHTKASASESKFVVRAKAEVNCMHVADSTTIVMKVGFAVRLQASKQVEQRSIVRHPSHLRLSNMVAIVALVNIEECVAAVAVLNTKECIAAVAVVGVFCLILVAVVNTEECVTDVAVVDFEDCVAADAVVDFETCVATDAVVDFETCVAAVALIDTKEYVTDALTQLQAQDVKYLHSKTSMAINVLHDESKKLILRPGLHFNDHHCPQRLQS